MPELLAKFAWDTFYSSLHAALWPQDHATMEAPADGYEPPSLRHIRFINLSAHPNFGIFRARKEALQRGAAAMFVIRDEYRLFMQDAMSLSEEPRQRQPLGSGKSFGCYYFLFYLLSLGQSVFLLPRHNTIYYFSRDGVQATTETGILSSEATNRAIEESWVLLDVDNVPLDSLDAFLEAKCVIWTSSPHEARMHKFNKVFSAGNWFMKAWSTKEIAAAEVPSLFGGMRVPSAQTIEAVINRALQDGLFSFRVLDTSGLFLIQPLVVRDESTGQACLQRTWYCVEFLSTYMAERTLDRAQHHLETFRNELAVALNTSITRSVAGTMVEGLMHRALTDDDTRLSQHLAMI
ncbi:hypothetical protein C8F01DRAFT_1106930 [Mycena amicta]|nr:hypothetical protein C8F01DRAFT_1106930 [Mycena amicta]